MNKHFSLISYLGGQYSDDYWSDVAIEHAIALAEELSDADWKLISTSWQTLDEVIQVRLAEISSEVLNWSEHIGAVLLAMLDGPSDEVVEASLDSLNSIIQSKRDGINQSEFRKRIDNVHVSGSVAYRVLANLKAKLAGN